jgi:DNA (cytosine-5)-methyltransferase 1
MMLIEADELVVDLFAGGGGASTGIERALGRAVDIAVNHSSQAIAMHERNHPQTRHFQEDVWKVSPREVCRGRRVGLLWLSPACTHFSKAKGKQNPKSAKIRSLASVAIRWAREVQPRVIFLENVEEFEDWGPLDNDGNPVKSKRGRSFKVWLGKLRAQGYVVEWRQLVASEYGAPTSRNRLYLIARSDGERIRWPEPTHGPRRAAAFRSAAECIDWTLPCPSIFLTSEQARPLGVKRPLVPATLRRIAAGLRRFVLEADRPFIAPRSDGEIALPFMIQSGYGERKGQAPRVLNLHEPLGTIVAGGQKHALVTAFIAKSFGGPNGNVTPGSDIREPLSTITRKDHNNLVTVALERSPAKRSEQVRGFLVKYYSKGENAAKQMQSLSEPLHTITTKARFGLVIVEGVEYEVTDIGMRMLAPHELWTAQGFDDPDVSGLTKTAQVELCGNSVCPPVAEALVRANFARSSRVRRVA